VRTGEWTAFRNALDLADPAPTSYVNMASAVESFFFPVGAGVSKDSIAPGIEVLAIAEPDLKTCTAAGCSDSETCTTVAFRTGEPDLSPPSMHFGVATYCIPREPSKSVRRADKADWSFSISEQSAVLERLVFLNANAAACVLQIANKDVTSVLLVRPDTPTTTLVQVDPLNASSIFVLTEQGARPVRVLDFLVVGDGTALYLHVGVRKTRTEQGTFYSDVMGLWIDTAPSKPAPRIVPVLSASIVLSAYHAIEMPYAGRTLSVFLMIPKTSLVAAPEKLLVNWASSTPTFTLDSFVWASSALHSTTRSVIGLGVAARNLRVAKDGYFFYVHTGPSYQDHCAPPCLLT
jgi:hypothetical protein